MHKKKSSKTHLLFEAELLPGLKDVVMAEIDERLKGKAIFFKTPRPDQIIFEYDGNSAVLTSLTTVVSLFRLIHFPIKGPQELLSETALRRIAGQVKFAKKACINYPWKSFRISAAGRNSRLMSKIVSKIEEASGLQYDQNDGEMVIKIRPSHSTQKGWEVLCRLTPRPLATRKWRACNTPGALNGTIAAAMLRLLAPQRNNSLLNLMSGSGSLLIEALNNHKLSLVVGCDNNKDMLNRSKINIATTEFKDRIKLLLSDIAALPFAKHSFDLICVDPPWGERLGRREDNKPLYENLLTAIEHCIKEGGKAALITQDISSLIKAFEKIKNHWIIANQLKVFQGGFNPTIVVLQRMQTYL